jgi:hypothetical protein
VVEQWAARNNERPFIARFERNPGRGVRGYIFIFLWNAVLPDPELIYTLEQ